MPRLLVSVRSATEAMAAFAGGADLIDIKEPSRGPLGRADDAVIAAIVAAVAGRRPVSAALGELTEQTPIPVVAGLSYLKVGLANRQTADWRGQLRRLAARCGPALLVPVAYADWQRAHAPLPNEVLAVAVELGGAVFLLDTWQKTGRTLLDFCRSPELSWLCQSAAASGMAVALAGSLREPIIRQVLALGPDIIAVRGAACRGGSRDAAIDVNSVRRLAELVHASAPARKSITRTFDSRPATRGNQASTTPARTSPSQSTG